MSKLPESDIKEELSRCFVNALAGNDGYSSSVPSSDFGVDLCIEEILSAAHDDGKVRIYKSGRSLDIQLKSTTESSITYIANEISYNLEVKNYNDLVLRAKSGVIPLILILLVLPDSRSQWVTLQDDVLELRKHAYWFVGKKESNISTNTSTIAIRIPQSNKVTSGVFDSFFSQYYD